VAGFELYEFSDKWAKLRQRFENAPPPPYAGDAEWANTLARIATIAERGKELIEQEKAKQAHEELAKIRRELAALRARNGVVAFSDRIDAYGKQIEKISPLRVTKRPLQEADYKLLRDRSEEILRLLDVMAAEAPQRYRDDPGFAPALEDNRRAVKTLLDYLDKRHERGIKGSIRDVRAAYGLLFLKYG
jgi:hypothetical protein